MGYTYGVEFTPTIVGDLKEFLINIKEYENNKKGLIIYLNKNLDGIKNIRMAENLLNSLKNYKLMDENEYLTQFANKLIESNNIYKDFASHIINELDGDKYLLAIEGIQKEGLYKVNGENIIRYINDRFKSSISTTVKYFNNIKLWIEKAGILDRWDIKIDILKEIIGSSLGISENSYFDFCDGLNYNQVCFLKELISSSVDSREEYKGADIAKWSELKYNVKFSFKTLKKDIIVPLSERGLIEIGESMSGSATRIRLSNEVFNNTVYKKIVSRVKYTTNVKHSFSEACKILFTRIDGEKVDGQVLESIGYYIARLLGLENVRIRERSIENGMCEIDILGVDLRFYYSKWQIQCKDTKNITSDRIAREVGIAQINNTSNILFVFTGKLTENAKIYAKKVIEKTNLNIYFLGENELSSIIDDKLQLNKIINAQSYEINRIKNEIEYEMGR